MRELELAKTLEATSDAAFAVDLGGEIRTWNKAAEKLFGYKAEEIVGKQCSTIFAGRTETDLPICRESCNVLTCVQKGRGIPNFDMRVNTRTGKQEWVNVSILTITNDRIDRRLVVHLVRDIGNRKQVEAITNQIVQMSKTLVSNFNESDDTPPTVGLTEQEKKILHLLADGKTSKAIARELKISVSTLRNHVSHINQKLNTSNRLGAVLQAIKNGLI